MKAICERAKQTINPKCLIKGKLNKKGCRVSLNGTPSPRLIVDFDKPESPLGQNDYRCDYLVILEDQEKGIAWTVPLELKKGQLHANEVIRQLRAGAKAAEKIVPKVEPIEFRPVAATGSMSIHERNILRAVRSKIRFRGQKEYVRRIECGDQLITALRK